jgi:hypothetical protein
VGNGAYMIDTHFLWEDMGNYFWYQEIFTGISGHEDDTESLKNIVGINEQIFGKNILQVIVNETIHDI